MLNAVHLRLPAGPALPDWPQRFAQLARTARDRRLRAYYAAGIADGAAPLSSVPLVALDVETTGLDPSRDGIVSIGIVPMDLQRIAASASRHWIVRPRAPLAAESVAIHGITDTQVRAAPDLALRLGELLQSIAGRVLVVHGRAIERGFLAAALQARIGEGIVFPVIDTMELEARLHRGRRGSWIDRLLGRQPPPLSIRLADSRARYGLPRYRPHHALTDALGCAELLQAQVAHRFGGDVALRELWT